MESQRFSPYLDGLCAFRSIPNAVGRHHEGRGGDGKEWPITGGVSSFLPSFLPSFESTLFTRDTVDK